ncbi:hypothetical protein ABBQ38_007627 [Trebouxia sp. C0009 RCD-2024]
MGATMPAQCWGPLIGAKVIQYRTAVVIGVVFQAVGMLAFGSETYTVFSVAATLGAILVFPGARHLKVGGTNSHPPYLTGMGAVFMTWLLAPLVTMCCAVPVYLWSRKTIFRSEDPFHNALWDEATVRELAADDASQDVKGWLQRAHTYLFQPDIFASVSSNDTLLRIHSTAEEYDKATEELFAPVQKVAAVFLSLVYGSLNGHTSFGAFAMMRDIAASNEVVSTSSLGMGLRCASAAGLTLGVQLVKMTPYRSHISIFFTLQSVVILSIMGLRGGILSYSTVSAVIAVGLVEGARHVNWRMLALILKWWILGFGVFVGGTAALITQGKLCPHATRMLGCLH